MSATSGMIFIIIHPIFFRSVSFKEDVISKFSDGFILLKFRTFVFIPAFYVIAQIMSF